jgi:hypothetical protein
MTKVDCDTLAGHLGAICRGTHRKGDGSFHTLDERRIIVSKYLGIPLEEVEIEDVRQEVMYFSGIGDRLHNIVSREVGIPACDACRSDILKLNHMTPDQVRADKLPLATRMVERATVLSPKWWQRWGAALAPGLARDMVLGWIEEAVGKSERHLTVNTATLRTLTWSYGVTTVKQRLDDGLLERTLTSLSRAGFDSPRLFIDGDNTGFERFGLEMTHRWPVIQAYGNWLLGMMELYVRNPDADMYAMFQDDFVTVKNLRGYLDNIVYPDKGYLNLYTFPHNQPDQLSRRFENGVQTHPDLDTRKRGFYPACQNGKGAVALVFSRECFFTLMSQPHMMRRMDNVKRRNKAIDGAVVESMRSIGWKEYVHNPSLVQHTGHQSSMGNQRHQLSISFPGEEWDALTMLNEEQGR